MRLNNLIKTYKKKYDLEEELVQEKAKHQVEGIKAKNQDQELL